MCILYLTVNLELGVQTGVPGLPERPEERNYYFGEIKSFLKNIYFRDVKVNMLTSDINDIFILLVLLLDINIIVYIIL